MLYQDLQSNVWSTYIDRSRSASHPGNPTLPRPASYRGGWQDGGDSVAQRRIVGALPRRAGCTPQARLRTRRVVAAGMVPGHRTSLKLEQKSIENGRLRTGLWEESLFPCPG